MTTTVVDFARPARDEPNRVLITAIAMLAVTMQLLDTTIANVALPHMQGSLAATQDEIAWVLTSYIVAAAISTPVTGWLAGQLGRTRLFSIAMFGFTVTSALCGLATTLPQIVLFRIMQGLFGASLVPLSQAILLDAYPRGELQRAMGIFSMGVMIAPILGPVLGGYLTDEFSWRWCFFINIPIGIVAIAGAIAFVPEVPGHARKLDWFGFGFLGLGVTCLQLVLDRGESKGWFQSGEIQLEGALALFCLYMFVAHSATTARPFFDVRMFKDRTYIVSTIIMMLIFIVYYGSMVLTPQMLQQEFGYPVLTAGLIMAPRGAGTILAIMITNRLSKWIEPRALVGFGLLLSGVTLYLMSGWNLMTSETSIIIMGLLQGAGSGCINVPITTMAFATLPGELRTEATSFYSLTRNIGSAIGVSVAASQLVESTQINHGYLAEFMTPFRHMSLPHGAMGMHVMNLGLTQQAAMIAFINIFWLLGILCVAIIPLVFFLRVPKAAGAAPAGAAAAD
ncbi:MAG TPA: DHA2 family efflux MFS transporter permease subunit [Alphaproteobacteria bacterium]|nr:DHA2 family efflux MFS transporter permease subunit [Alphaproteobacteria bacterium]